MIDVHFVSTTSLWQWDDAGSWGDIGWLVRSHTDPGSYYGALRAYMAAGGSIEPLEVGFTQGEGSRLIVFNGQHRLTLARELGWATVPVIQSACEWALDVDWTLIDERNAA